MTNGMAPPIPNIDACGAEQHFSPPHGKGKVRSNTIVALPKRSPKRDATNRSQRKERLAAMGEMAAKIAHEIRNPLGSIELFATSLQAALEGQPELMLLAERISSGVKSIDAIISNLLLFIRPSQAIQLERFDIYEVLDDALFFMKHIADKENSIDIKTTYSHRPLFIKGDPELMKQVCLNIILNAVQCMPEGGRLGITTICQIRNPDEERTWMEIRFSDSGMGIEPGQILKIFDPFFTTKERGTGLGLSIVHSIVEMHGGTIDVDSVPGKGTDFCIGLPLCRKMEDSKGSALGLISKKEALA